MRKTADRLERVGFILFSISILGTYSVFMTATLKEPTIGMLLKCLFWFVFTIVNLNFFYLHIIDMIEERK